NPCPVTAEPVPAAAARAGPERVSMGAAAAVTAEADRNARRGEPLGPRTCLFSIARTNMTDSPQCQALPDKGDISARKRRARLTRHRARGKRTKRQRSGYWPERRAR